MTSLENSIWINAIVMAILCFSFYVVISRPKISNKKKIFLSIFAVLLIAGLGFLSFFSWWKYKSKINDFKIIKPKVVEVKSFSDSENKKYLVNVVVPIDLNKEQVKSVVEKTTKYIRKKLPRSSVIWLAVYSKVLPTEEFYAKKDNPYFICLSQWVHSSYSGFFSDKLKNPENYKGIEIFWKK